MPKAPVSELEQALDELYRVDVDEFISTRKRLAKQLKESGSVDASATVAGARKPTVSAWIVNQLARRKRKEIDLLLDAGHRLREAQASLLRGGEQKDFVAARKAQQSAVTKLTKAARLLLEERGGASPRAFDQVVETLRIAAITDEGRELLARGRFDKPPASSGGFDALAALAPANQPPTSITPKRRAQQREVLTEAKSQLREAEKARRELERQAATAEKEAERLRRDLETAKERADEARAAADEAAGAVTTAQRNLHTIEERRNPQP